MQRQNHHHRGWGGGVGEMLRTMHALLVHKVVRFENWDYLLSTNSTLRNPTQGKSLDPLLRHLLVSLSLSSIYPSVLRRVVIFRGMDLSVEYSPGNVRCEQGGRDDPNWETRQDQLLTLIVSN